MKRLSLFSLATAALLAATLPSSYAQTPAPTTPATTPTAPSAPTTPPAAPVAPTTPTAPAETKKVSSESKLARLTTVLALTPDEQTKIKGIYTDEEKQIKAARQDKTVAKTDLKAKILKIRDEADAKIVAVLTPDQVKKYTDYKHHKV